MKPGYSINNERCNDVVCVRNKTNATKIESHPCDKYKNSLINCLTKHGKVNLAECEYQISCLKLCITRNKTYFKIP